MIGTDGSGFLVPSRSSRSTKFVSISASQALPHGEKVTESASFTE